IPGRDNSNRCNAYGSGFVDERGEKLNADQKQSAGRTLCALQPVPTMDFMSGFLLAQTTFTNDLKPET
ncbi:hypothetical protein MYX82_09600, partial [Acidobacteria bacterium AH-259-D05]|nr:hypothetical protein [Acidobacteria bacterium AH-259-D05]